MYYGTIKKNDVANGTGVRVSLFVSGCRNHCKGCFQPETWNFLFGKEFTKKEEDEIIEALKPSWIDGITILGGEPFEPENQEAILPFIRRIKEELPNKTIWMFSGYLLDKDIIPTDGKVHTEYSQAIVNLLDVLVDGPFIEEKKNICLKFRGSENQRIILVQESLIKKEIVLSSLNK